MCGYLLWNATIDWRWSNAALSFGRAIVALGITSPPPSANAIISAIGVAMLPDAEQPLPRSASAAAPTPGSRHYDRRHRPAPREALAVGAPTTAPATDPGPCS